MTFPYFGITSQYTCVGLEDRVRRLLLHLGARKDSKVLVQGCPGPFNAPAHSAFVTADFYALVPADDAAGSETITTHWTALNVTPQHPGFMGAGDCELIQQMKDVITKNFSLRDVNYQTSCFPREVTPDGFTVTGQVLRAG